MARHLGDVSWREFNGAIEALIVWLKQANVAGSVAGRYSLYRALEEEWHRAHQPLIDDDDEAQSTIGVTDADR